MKVSEFGSDEDLVKACLASCYIPIYYEAPVLFREQVCIDGGATDNQPTFDSSTVCVSPVNKAARIKPEAQYPSSLMLIRKMSLPFCVSQTPC